jgi:hypothetical protein
MPKGRAGKHWLEYAIFGAALCAAVFTGCQAYLATKQLRTARDVLAVTRDGERRQLRAYVGVTVIPLPTPNPFIPPAVPNVTFGIRNSGATPAYDVSHSSAVGFCDYPLAADTRFPEQALPLPPEPMTIFPGTLDNLGIEISAERTLTADEFSGLSAGRAKRLCFWGTVRYRDAFEGRHYTNFCYSYYGTAETMHREACQKHNDAD